jgi:hypothetical protein
VTTVSKPTTVAISLSVTGVSRTRARHSTPSTVSTPEVEQVGVDKSLLVGTSVATLGVAARATIEGEHEE